MKFVAFLFLPISIRAVEPRFGVAITTLLLGSSMFLTWFAIGIVTDICIQKHEIEGHLSMQMYTFVQSCRQHDRERPAFLRLANFDSLRAGWIRCGFVVCSFWAAEVEPGRTVTIAAPDSLGEGVFVQPGDTVPGLLGGLYAEGCFAAFLQ